MTVVQELFEREPAPRLGKPPSVWTGVSKRTTLETADQKARPWVCRCPAPMCFYNTSHKAEKDAQTALDTHPCPWFAGGTTTLSWGVMAESFVAPIWKLLDECMDEIMLASSQVVSADPLEREAGSRALATLKPTARAYANTLAILMPPFFRHPDEIALEAKVRYDKRTAGEEYETSGMGNRRYEKAGSTRVMDPPTPSAPRTYVPRGGKVLSDDEKTGIKMALAMGGFPVEQLAKTYGVTAQQIEACR